MKLLKFKRGNAKLNTSIGILDIAAGHSCPMANECFSIADKITGKITDGQNTKFRCYAASAEAAFPSVRRLRWHNFDLLKQAGTVEKMATLIDKSMPKNVSYIRIHSSGDFFNEKYFLAWLNVALNNPNIIFYCYSKMLNFVVKYNSKIPANFRITASYGGKLDSLIETHNLISAKVISSVKEKNKLKLEIDHDDSLPIKHEKNFGLYLHNTQPAGSQAAKDLKELRKLMIGGYGVKFGKNNETPITKKIKVFIDFKPESVKLKPMKFTMNKNKQLTLA